jgi:hypothetical protein
MDSTRRRALSSEAGSRGRTSRFMTKGNRPWSDESLSNALSRLPSSASEIPTGYAKAHFERSVPRLYSNDRSTAVL